MSQINVNRIKDSNEGAPDFPSGVNVGGITSTVTLGVTNLNPTNVNVSGVVTATTFDGSMSATGTPTLGLGVTINTSGLNISGVATAGIVSATTLYGNGANLTGIALSIAPLNYNPAVYGVDLAHSTGIGLTFNQAIKAGSGEVTLRIAGAGGTVVQTWGVGSSITYGKSSYGDTISLSLVSNLSNDTVYHLSYPSGAFTNTGGDVSYVGTAYTFDSKINVNQLFYWGAQTYGKFGLNNLTWYSSPVQLPGTTWERIDIGWQGTSEGGHSIATKSDGTLWTWGENINGTLGHNNRTNYSSPVQVPGTTWTKMISGGRMNCQAIKTDNTLWVWGQNDEGHLGINAGGHRSSPCQVPGTWSAVHSDQASMMGVRTNGTLWAWGANDSGQLGNNTAGGPTKVSSPIQIGSGTDWSTSGAGKIYIDYVGAAIKTDGTLWMWGNNFRGTLGQNDRTYRSSPVQVPGTTWKSISNVSLGNIASKTDGTLWVWGYGVKGQLGLNSTADVSSPTQIPGTWSGVMGAGNYHGLATRTDGTLWGWGDNEEGQLGQNQNGDPAARSSPVQIGSSSGWSTTVGDQKISGGRYSGYSSAGILYD